MVRIAEVHDCFTATRDSHGSKNEIYVLEKIQWVLWNPFQIVFFLCKEATDQRDINVPNSGFCYLCLFYWLYFKIIPVSLKVWDLIRGYW